MARGAVSLGANYANKPKLSPALLQHPLGQSAQHFSLCSPALTGPFSESQELNIVKTAALLLLFQCLILNAVLRHEANRLVVFILLIR